jgi:hypothetical protein
VLRIHCPKEHLSLETEGSSKKGNVAESWGVVVENNLDATETLNMYKTVQKPQTCCLIKANQKAFQKVGFVGFPNCEFVDIRDVIQCMGLTVMRSPRLCKGGSEEEKLQL